MGSKAKLDPNDTYLFQTLKQIKTNCESSNEFHGRQVNYWDLVSFQINCGEPLDLTKEWQYDPLKEDFLINLAEKYKSLKHFSQRDQEAYWKLYINAIKENKSMTSISIYFKPNDYYPDHLDRFEALLNAIEDKKSLQKLFIELHEYTFENVPKLGQLTNLFLNARMNVEDLVQLCRSNPNLRDISFINKDLYGRFTDVVPYCGELQSLRLVMKDDIDATEYAGLAKLPKLQRLILRGKHQKGTLTKLFHGLESKDLKTLIIPNTLLSKDETQAMTRIHSLSSIMSGFDDVADLAHLRTPGYVGIYAKPGQLIVMDQLMDLVKSSVLVIAKKDCPILEIKYAEELGKLEVIFGLIDQCKDYDEREDDDENEDSENEDSDERENSDGDEDHENVDEEDIQNIANHIARVVHLADVLQFSISGKFKSSMLQTIYQELASKKPNELRKLNIRDCSPFTLEHATTLSSIQSLTTIFCDHCYLKNIFEMKVQQLNGITEMRNREDRIKTEMCEILLIHTDKSSKLILQFCKNFTPGDNCAQAFAPLAYLKNLKILEIKSHIGVRTFMLFIKLIKDLQELEVQSVGPEDLIELSQIQSLKVLKCGFSSSKSVDHLAKLNQLESLTITDHPKGFLASLLTALAAREDQVLRSLSVHRDLTSQDFVELTGLKCLERLQLGLSNDKNWKSYNPVSPSSGVVTPTNLELIAKLSNLKELSIHFDYEKQAVEKLLKSLQSPQRLLKLSLPSHDLKLISKFQELRSLECFLHQVEDVKYIATLRNLTELRIHNSQKNLMTDFFKKLKVLSNLQSLLLDDTELKFEEVVEVTKMNWLTRLRLGLAEKPLLLLLLQFENLETLEITSTHYAEQHERNFCVLFLKACQNLISISLSRYFNLLTKQHVNSILRTIRQQRNPDNDPPFRLFGIWWDFKKLDQLDEYDEAYLQLEGPKQNEYQLVQESHNNEDADGFTDGSDTDYFG
ncbi:uncharacterized protein LOC108111419 [Drosophila eugracilis]|uniref:uncharacterized protein LOC108111419 n=1 Tax=Drosophila eugracilis TaxID=29029 RepID=UPI001BDAC736|nr:uncharacterized protein LOC108111419 [Drosophila eugracilis]